MWSDCPLGNKASPSKTGFFLVLYFTDYLTTKINCPRQQKEQNRTTLSFSSRVLPSYSGIIGPVSSQVNLQLENDNFLEPFTTHLKLTTHSTSEAISPEFLRFRKTSVKLPGLLTEVNQAFKNLLLIFNTSFTKIKRSKIKRSIEIDCTVFIFFVSSISFDCRTQSTDRVRLGSIYYAGMSSKMT